MDQYERKQFWNSRLFRLMRIGVGGMMIMFQSIIADIIARVGVYISVDKDNHNPSRFFGISKKRTRIKQSRYLISDVMQIFEEVTSKSIHQRRNNFTTVTN